MKVIPWDGAPISAPGIYSGVPMKVYHGPRLCDGPSISSSGLRKMERSPLHYWDSSPYNPNGQPEEDKSAWAFGRAAHCLFLGDGSFLEEFAIRPDKWDSWRTNDSKKWRGEQELAGKTCLTPDDLENLSAMAKSLAAHPTIQHGLLNGLVEHTIVWKDPKTGVWVKARPDVIPTESRVTADLKKTTNASPVSVRRAIGEFGYHQQMALVGEGLRRVADMEVETHNLVFLEDKRPWAVNITPLSPMAIHYGERQNRRALDRFAECLNSGVWPTYDDDEVPAELPEYLTRRLESEDKWGLLPKLED